MNDYYDLGTFTRKVSTTSEEAQRWFDRGLTWNYGYHHEEAIECFSRALENDPGCVMARWGIAYASGPNYNKQWPDCDPDPDFLAALEDDLNTPRALAALFELARELNRCDTDDERGAIAARLRASGELLGLLSADPDAWCRGGEEGDDDDAEIDALLAARQAARERRDFAEADRIREELTNRGILIEDGPTGARWRRAAAGD